MNTPPPEIHKQKTVRILEKLYRYYYEEALRFECSDGSQKGYRLSEQCRETASAISDAIDAIEGNKFGAHMLAKAEARIEELRKAGAYDNYPKAIPR